MRNILYIINIQINISKNITLCTTIRGINTYTFEYFVCFSFHLYFFPHFVIEVII